jgi:hypothetical protein
MSSRRQGQARKTLREAKERRRSQDASKDRGKTATKMRIEGRNADEKWTAQIKVVRLLLGLIKVDQPLAATLLGGAMPPGRAAR